MNTTRRQFALLTFLALTMGTGCSALAETPSDSAAGTAPVVIEAGASATYVNVMKGVQPKMPAFPKLAPMRGVVRGYVKDSHG